MDPEGLMSEPRKKSKRSLLDYAPYLMGVFVAVLLVHDIFGTHGYLAMGQKRQGIQKIRQGMEKLNKGKLGLQQGMQDFKSDPETHRKIAPEKYCPARPSEKSIQMPAP